MTRAGSRLMFTSLALLALVSAACGKKIQPAATPTAASVATTASAAPSPAPAPARPPASVSAPAPQPAAPAAALTEDDLFARKTLADLNAERPLGRVLFDLDQATIREDARAVLQANAQWLTRWPSTRITVEGHADERGTAEYNLALGERRANAVVSYLASLGVSPGRMTTVSLGKEVPVCLQNTEYCWQENRRGQFVITGK